MQSNNQHDDKLHWPLNRLRCSKEIVNMTGIQIIAQRPCTE